MTTYKKEWPLKNDSHAKCKLKWWWLKGELPGSCGLPESCAIPEKEIELWQQAARLY